MSKILGIDVGGVIMSNATEDADTSFFSDGYLKTPQNTGAIEIITKLVPQFDAVYIVSKCREKIQQKTLKWFSHHHFHQKTKIPQQNVYFCIQRHEKAPICEKLGITHFIDDKLEVLSYLETVPNKFLFKPRDKEVKQYSEFLPLVKRVESWQELSEVIL